MKAERLAQHVAELAEQLNVEVIIRGSGRACRSERWISIAPIRGQVGYLTALHEIGHIVAANPSLRLQQEAVAWRWALANSIIEPTYQGWKMILRCLDSYHRRQQRWRSMKPSAEFDQLRAEIRATVDGLSS